MSSLPFIFTWLLLWFLYHGILNIFLIPSGFSFRMKGYAVSLFALVLSYLVADLYKLQIAFDLGVSFVVALIMHLTLLPLNKILTGQVRKTSPILPRYFDVLFQQTMLIALSFYFRNGSGNLFFVFSAIVFMLGHLPILFFKRVENIWKGFVITFSFLGGAMFSWLGVRYGLLAPLTIHISLYYIFALATTDEDSVLP